MSKLVISPNSASSKTPKANDWETLARSALIEKEQKIRSFLAEAGDIEVRFGQKREGHDCWNLEAVSGSIIGISSPQVGSSLAKLLSKNKTLHEQKEIALLVFLHEIGHTALRKRNGPDRNSLAADTLLVLTPNKDPEAFFETKSSIPDVEKSIQTERFVEGFCDAFSIYSGRFFGVSNQTEIIMMESRKSEPVGSEYNTNMFFPLDSIAARSLSEAGALAEERSCLSLRAICVENNWLSLPTPHDLLAAMSKKKLSGFQSSFSKKQTLSSCQNQAKKIFWHR